MSATLVQKRRVTKTVTIGDGRKNILVDKYTIIEGAKIGKVYLRLVDLKQLFESKHRNKLKKDLEGMSDEEWFITEMERDDGKKAKSDSWVKERRYNEVVGLIVSHHIRHCPDCLGTFVRPGDGYDNVFADETEAEDIDVEVADSEEEDDEVSISDEDVAPEVDSNEDYVDDNEDEVPLRSPSARLAKKAAVKETKSAEIRTKFQPRKSELAFIYASDDEKELPKEASLDELITDLEGEKDGFTKQIANLDDEDYIILELSSSDEDDIPNRRKRKRGDDETEDTQSAKRVKSAD